MVAPSSVIWMLPVLLQLVAVAGGDGLADHEADLLAARVDALPLRGGAVAREVAGQGDGARPAGATGRAASPSAAARPGRRSESGARDGSGAAAAAASRPDPRGAVTCDYTADSRPPCDCPLRIAWTRRVDVVLVRPARPANVAAACRALKNMGLRLAGPGRPAGRPRRRGGARPRLRRVGRPRRRPDAADLREAVAGAHAGRGHLGGAPARGLDAAAPGRGGGGARRRRAASPSCSVPRRAGSATTSWRCATCGSTSPPIPRSRR